MKMPRASESRRCKVSRRYSERSPRRDIQKYVRTRYKAMKKNTVVIGYGGMGGWHVDHLLKSDVCNLLGVYDIKEERTALAKSREINTYKSLEEVLFDERVELVTVAIPNDSHKEVCIKALKAGKNVICEKPVMLSVSDLKDVIAVANEAGRLFTVHQNRRWDVDFLAMKQIHDSGELGKVLNIESRIHGSRGIPSDWRGIREHGGGMLFDWGIHLIDQLLQIFTGKIERIYCTFDHITNKEVDDGFRLTMYFDDGSEAYCEVGTYNFISMPRFYMRAEKGTALISDWREETKVVKCKYWHESDVLPVETAAGLTKTMAPRDSVTVSEYNIERPHSDVHDFYRNFTRSIDGEDTQLVTHAQMLRVLNVIEAAFKSVEENQVISVNL